MPSYKIVTFLLGILVAIIILAAGFDLSALTSIFWPTMIGLMALGGSITGIGGYIFVAFLIALNGLLYLVVYAVITAIYKSIRR